MSNFEIPDSNDPEWQSEMLERLSECISDLWDEFDPEGHNESFKQARDIIVALEECTGQ